MSPGLDRARDFHIPVPVGLNTVDAPSELGPRDAAALINMINAENGLRGRLGFVEWCVQVDGAAEEIRTILPYLGSTAANNKLWACTRHGIYPATASATSPAQAVAFATVDATAGYGAGVSFVSTGGVRALFYTDESNGLYAYPEGGPWAQVTQGAGGTQISGVNPANLAQAIQFKGRLWFVEKGTTHAWYLGAGALYGAATLFDFGQQFPHGGNLACLYTWTVDGGAGVDDILVAISTSGDVVLYQGTDPTQAATFNKIADWYVGAVPAGRRLAMAFGGDLLILTTFGAIPVSRLISGRSLLSPDIYSTYKVRNLFNALMIDRRSLLGWSIVPHPGDNSVLITYPALAGESRQQFASATATSGWSQYQGLPIVSADAWNGDLYFGTADGRVCINKGYIDNVKIDGTLAQAYPVAWSGVTAFRSRDGKRKQVHIIRTKVVAQGARPSLLAQARFDFDTSPVLQTLPAVPVTANAWDAAVPPGGWDAAASQWAGGASTFEITMGAIGCGTFVAVAWAGSSMVRTSLVGFDVTAEEGGFL